MNVVKRRALAIVATGKNLADKAGDVLVRPLVVGSTALFAAASSRAAGVTIDTTDIVSTITGGVATVSAIGIAVISLVVVIKLFKWVQRVLLGAFGRGPSFGVVPFFIAKQ